MKVLQFGIRFELALDSVSIYDKTYFKDGHLPVMFGAHSDATIVRNQKLKNQQNKLSFLESLELYRNEERVKR